jgi:hypothetical protein
VTGAAETMRRAADLIEDAATDPICRRLLAALLRDLADDAELVGPNWLALDLARVAVGEAPFEQCRAGCRRTRTDGFDRCVRHDRHTGHHHDGVPGTRGWTDEAVGFIPDVTALEGVS